MLFFDIDVEVSLQFECPKCDGSCWSTSYWGTERATGRCSTCKFRWPRSEDYKVLFVKLAPVNEADQKTFFDKVKATLV